MTPTRLQRLLLLLVALWLPLQSLAAFGMEQWTQAATAPAIGAGVAEEACPHHDAATPAEQTPAQDCERCGVCHLASAGYLPGQPVAAAGLVPAGRDFLSLAVTARASHTPEPPQRPPQA